MKNPVSGLAVINKPAGMTSFQAVSIVKKKLKTRKAGHTGTLDPFAEGLLVILLGDFTRFFDYFMNYRKTYTAEAVFGEERDTEDITGTKISETDNIPDLNELNRNLSSYTGEITQIPPAYSAVHINGKRAYQLAREGIKAELKPRKAFIHSLDINSYDNRILNFTVSCSSGTYIRSIARDLARDCGSGAYLKSLLRTDIGNFNISDAAAPDVFSGEMVLPPYEAVKKMGISIITVKDSFRAKLFNGIMPVSDNFTPLPPEGLSAVFDSSHNFAALIEKNSNEIRYRFVIPESNRQL